jgi:hypothetical protein
MKSLTTSKNLQVTLLRKLVLVFRWPPQPLKVVPKAACGFEKVLKASYDMYSCTGEN